MYMSAYSLGGALHICELDNPSVGQGCTGILTNYSKLIKLTKLNKLKVRCAYNINECVSI
jgi:hypothetical protein